MVVLTELSITLGRKAILLKYLALDSLQAVDLVTILALVFYPTVIKNLLFLKTNLLFLMWLLGLLLLKSSEIGRIVIHFGQGRDSKYGNKTIEEIAKNVIKIMDRVFFIAIILSYILIHRQTKCISCLISIN